MRSARISRYIAVSAVAAALIFSVSCRRTESLEAGKAKPGTLVKLLPARVQTVGALDVRRFLDIRGLRDELAKGKMKEGLDKFAKASGIDPLKDVYLVVTGGASKFAIDKAMPTKFDDAMIINLKHDQAGTIAALKKVLPDLAEERYRDVLVLSGFGSIAVKGVEFKPIIAFLDPSNVVVGNDGMVRSIVDVYRGQAPSVTTNIPLNALFNKLEGSPTGSAAVLLPPEAVSKAAAAAPQLKVIEGIQGLAMAFESRPDGISFQIITSGGTEQQNKELAGTLTALKMLGAANPPSADKSKSALVEMVNSLTISSGKDFVRVHALIGQELLKQIQGQAAEKLAKVMPKDGPAPTPGPGEQAEQKKEEKKPSGRL